MLFVGLTPDGESSLADIRAYVEKYRIAWPNGYGARKAIRAYGVRGLPTVFVIGRDGAVAWSDEQGGTLDEAIEKALATDVAI